MDLNDEDKQLVATEFDAVFYLSEYPHAVRDQRDALDHFIQSGWRDGNNPNGWFSVTAYRDANPDVESSGQNPFVHYLRYGRAEGRRSFRRTDARDCDVIRPYFDFGFYKARNPDVAEAGWNELDHFCAVGWKEGRDPAPWFSTEQYLRANRDIAKKGCNPFAHYVVDGRSEGRAVFPAAAAPAPAQVAIEFDTALIEHFDRNHYIGASPDVDFSCIDPLVHFMESGWREGRNPSSLFCTAEYLESYPDVRDSGINPLRHYVDCGRFEGRQPNQSVRRVIEEAFDEAFYRAGDPPLGCLSAVEHFVAFGWREGRDPCAWFSSKFYNRIYPDVAQAGCNPFWHYLVAGRSEGRCTRPHNARPMQPGKLPAILFVGHSGMHAGAEVVLLEIVRWYAEHTRNPLKVLLLSPGRLASRYAEYAEMFVLPGRSAEPPWDELTAFLGGNFELCYVNTVAAARFHAIYARLLANRNIPVLLHVHEMRKVLLEFQEDFERLRPYVKLVVSVSATVTLDLIEVYGCDARDIFQSHAFIRIVAPTGSEVLAARQAARTELEVAEGDFLVLGCGSVYERKGPDIFLDVAIRSARVGGKRSLVFVWLGEGPDLEALRARVRDAGMEPRIRFVGFRSNASQLIAAADLFFLSSREDPFPLVCMEAAQFAIPSMYFYEATGMRDFLRNDAGIPVRLGDVYACVQSILSLAASPVRAEALGATARARLLSEYSAESKITEIAVEALRFNGGKPQVSVIVPVYNHSRFLKARIESILAQSLRLFEVIILDDCSSDDSVAVAETYLHDRRVRLIRNEENSGSPFLQWAKGILAASADVVWIAEGDDACSENLLAELLPAFDDPRVSLAFCRTEIIDEDGVTRGGVLSPYLRAAGFDEDASPRVWDGYRAVAAFFAAMCPLVNASSALLRRRSVAEIVGSAAGYKMCGDWLVYLHVLRSGSLFYSAKATNFFRRHTASTVHRVEGTETYFRERSEIAGFLSERFVLPANTLRRMLVAIEQEWARFRHLHPERELDQVFDRVRLIACIRRADRPLRIGFYVHGMLMSKGGIERIAADLANELSRRGHALTIFCRVWGTAAPVYQLDHAIELVPVFDEEAPDATAGALRDALVARSIDVFVPMLSEWLFEPIVDAANRVGVPVVASEHNDPWKITELWWNADRRVECFRKAEAVHLLLPEFRTSLPAEFASRITIIPNGLGMRPEVMMSKLADRPRRVIAVGRLEPQKRFDRLIRAFARCAPLLEGWTLAIFGEGSQRAWLEAMVGSLGITDRVSLPGTTPRIYAEYLESSLFVIPSEFEGFGMVVIEAKMAGLPGIAYRDCNGPNSLIKDGTDGLLVEPGDDGASLAEAILELASDEARREKFGKAARNAVPRYAIERVASEWEELLRRVARSEPAGVAAAPVPPEAPGGKRLTPPDTRGRKGGKLASEAFA